MTRRTFEQTKDGLEFMEKIDQLSKEQREHLRILVSRVVDCYLDDTAHGVMVIGKDDNPHASLITINCNEMEASVTLAKLELLFHEINTEDAPPKEMMN